jgi:hypothetical protein
MKISYQMTRLGTLLFFVLVPFVSLRSQEPNEPADYPESQQHERVEPASSPERNAGFVIDIESINKVRKPLAWAAEQQPTTSQTQGSYVFPTAEERRKRYVRNMVGPITLTRITVSAAIDQWDDDPPEWGQGAEGYGKRFASQFGKNAIRHTVSYGLSEALQLDTGFEKSQRKGFWPRLSDALVHSVTSRTRSGKRVISAPIFAGIYAGAIIPSETWYPSRYSYKDGLRSGTYTLGAGFALNIVREFIFSW